MDIAPETLMSLYRTMLRIRKVELRIESLYHLDEMKTPVHLCIGQEAVAAGVCAHLRDDDYVCSTHRGHGHYLAKGGDLPAMIAELYCRVTGCARGRGGSMHLSDVAKGFPGSSAIVGGGIPIGTGLALASVMQGRERVSAVFFGDGAANQGVLYESINFAALKRLPVVFVLEDNGFSVCSRTEARRRGRTVFHGMDARELSAWLIDGNSVLDVHAAAGQAVARARRGEGPSFLECTTYRLRGHAGAGSDAKLGYRTQAEIDAWEARCPIAQLKRELVAGHHAAVEELAHVDAELEAEIDAAFDFARRSPLPEAKDVGLYLFKE